MLKIICEMSGKETVLPCSATTCPLFGDCISKYRQITQKTQTNADRIRAMSDEELAKYLFDVEQGNFTIDCCDDRFCDTEHCCNDCTAAAIKWIKQPAKGE